MNKIGDYCNLYNFRIVNSKIIDNEINVYGRFNLGKQIETPILFKLSNYGGEFKIISTRGLSKFYGSEFHEFLKIIGCLDSQSDDAAVNQECASKESVYLSTIQALKTNLESQVTVDNSNLSLNGGYYVSGNLVVKNNSDIDIPSNSYSIYIGFLKYKKGNGFKESITTLKPHIPAHQAVSIKVNYVEIPSSISNGDKVAGLFEISNPIGLQNTFNQMVRTTNFNCNELDSILLNQP
jgi:hypothetical protein